MKMSQHLFIKTISRELNKNNFIGIFLKGKEKNTFAIGSKIKLYVDDQILSREVVPAEDFNLQWIINK